MTDTIIKGSGNSRSIKTVPNALTLYPDHASMIAAMINGTFPIDLGPLNQAGVEQIGTGYTKTEVLKDATAALYGKTAAATPDDIFSYIAQKLSDASKKCNIEYGSFSSTSNSKYAKTLNFSFSEKAVIIVHFIPDGSSVSKLFEFQFFIRPIDTGFYNQIYNSSDMGPRLVNPVVWGNTSITITQNWNIYASNYYYIAIG